MAQRAEEFSARLTGLFDITVCYRERGHGRAALAFLRRLIATSPDLCCVFDHSLDAVIAAHLYKVARGTRWILDTGDDIVALGQALGRGPIAMGVTRRLESIGYASAAHVVVRGRGHLDALRTRVRNTTWIPDGVDLKQFRFDPGQSPADPSLTSPLVIGLVGSSVWSHVRQTCYGQDLIELVHLLRKSEAVGVPVRGELVGDGSGIPVLERQCAELGIADAITFHGRKPYAELPAIVNRWHLCLSTQTNDAVGAVRTTGKLPLYLAMGRVVLASRVGEASRVLPDHMLVDYEGSSDRDYAARLAARAIALLRDGAPFRCEAHSVYIATRHFDYDRLAERYAELFAALI